MHPASDSKLRAIVGDSPGEAYVWCNECLRYENLDHRGHTPPKAMPLRVRLLRVAAEFFLECAEKLGETAMRKQAAYLVRIGQGVSEGRD